METVQYLAQIQAYTGIGIGLIIGLGAAGACAGFLTSPFTNVF